jgi:hypothetical protein
MADEAKDKSGPSTAVAAGSALLALGLAGLVVYFHYDAAAAQAELDTAKRQYREMAGMKKKIDESKRKGPAGAATPSSTEDILTFYDKKRAQAGIPQGMLTGPSQQDATLRGWKERAYTFTLNGTKEAPVPRAPVADFVRLVEDERPGVRAKNLKLSFTGDAFSTVTITFTTFQRE